MHVKPHAAYSATLLLARYSRHSLTAKPLRLKVPQLHLLLQNPVAPKCVQLVMTHVGKHLSHILHRLRLSCILPCAKGG